MKALLLIIVSLLLVNCGTGTRNFNEFTLYVEKFEQYSQEVGRPIKVYDLIIEFSKEDMSRNAECVLNAGHSPKISINKSAWKFMSDENKEALLLHELGHCVLGRGHRNDIIDDNGTAKSLMKSQLVTTEEYKALKSQYINELFWPEKY